MQLDGAHLLDGALVRDCEGANVRHFVAPELDAHGVERGRWEHVNNAAASGKFAARRDHIHVVVRKVDELLGQGLEVVLLVHLNAHGLHRRQHRLTHGASRGDNHPRHVPQHLRATAHDVRGRRKPLVRQRLVRRELRHFFLAKDRLQLCGEVFRFVAGCGDQQQRGLTRDGARGP